MPFTPKDWKNLPDVTTPISAEALEDMETRLSSYTDSQVSAEASTRAAADTAESTARSNADSTESTTRATNDTTNFNNLRGLDADLAGAWRPWTERSGYFFNGASITTPNLLPKGAGPVITPTSGSGSPLIHAFYFNASDYTVANYNQKMRLRTVLWSSASALNTDITFAIAPVNTATLLSAASNYSASLFSAGGFTTWAVHSSGQAAQTAHVAFSGEFYAADLNVGSFSHFVFTVTSAASISGSTELMGFAVLEHRYVPA